MPTGENDDVPLLSATGEGDVAFEGAVSGHRELDDGRYLRRAGYSGIKCLLQGGLEQSIGQVVGIRAQIRGQDEDEIFGADVAIADRRYRRSNRICARECRCRRRIKEACGQQITEGSVICGDRTLRAVQLRRA